MKYGSVYNSTVLHNRKQTASEDTFSNLANNTHGSESFQVRSGLTKRGKAMVCCHNSAENQIFEDIVRNAINMKEIDKEKYLYGLYRDCGVTLLDQKQYLEQGGFSWTDWSKDVGCSRAVEMYNGTEHKLE